MLCMPNRAKQRKKADDIWDFVLVPTWVLKCRYIEGKKQKDIEPLGEKDALVIQMILKMRDAFETVFD